MKHCLVALLCLVGVSYAGIKQQQQPVEAVQNIAADKKAYDEQGNVNLEPITLAKVGETIEFKVKDKPVVGIVRERLVDPKQGLRIHGELLGQEKAGFIFIFSKTGADQVTVNGALLFVNLNKIYILDCNEEKHILFFKEQEISVREADPNKTANNP